MRKIIKTVLILSIVGVFIVGGIFVQAQPNTQTIVSKERSFLEGFASIQEIRKVGEDHQVIVELEEGGEQLALIVTPKTILMNNETGMPDSVSNLKVGDRIYTYYSPIMTKSIPPQSVAFSILTHIPKDASPAHYVKVKEVIRLNDGSIQVLDETGNYLIRILPDTCILDFKTNQKLTPEDIKEGTELFAWFDFMTLSIPAQATARHVVVL